MVTKCCVSGCNETDGNGTELTFFKFPKTRHMKQKWLSAIRPRGRVSESSVVCSAHFLKDTDYQRVAGKDVLRTSVVPSVFNVDLKHTSSKRHTRRKKSVSPKPLSGEESDENADDDDSDADDEDNSMPDDNDKSIQDGEESIGKDCDKNITKDSENGPIERDNANTESNGQKCDEEISKDIENKTIKDSDQSKECNEKDSDEKMENVEVKEGDDCASKNNGKPEESEKQIDDKMGEDNNSGVDSLTNGRKTPEGQSSCLNGDVNSKCDMDTTEKVAEIKDPDNKDANTEPEPVLPKVDRPDEINKAKDTKDNTNESEKLDISVDTEGSTKMDDEDPDDPVEKIDNRTETESNPDYDELIRETQCKIMEMSEDAVPILDNVETILEEDESSKHSVEDVDENLFDEGSKEAEPVFVEISVDPDAMASPSPPESPSDCMMVVEDMQVQVDPRDMIASMDDPADDDDDDDVEVIEKTVEPVSLLTSSDEDDVILEEPHIDTVEVSDETSEDDMPLTRYVKKTSKQQKELNDKLKNIFWGTGSEFYCYSCQYTTKSKKDLSEHMKTHGQVNKKTSQFMVCDVCEFQSASEVQFARHKRKHKEDKKHKCHMCDYKARHKMSLVYHMKSHKTVEKIVYKCHKCSYQSAGPLALQRHMTAMHARVVIQCQMCSFTCKKKVNLQRHVRSAHVKRKKATRKFNKKASSSSEEEYVPGKDV